MPREAAPPMDPAIAARLRARLAKLDRRSDPGDGPMHPAVLHWTRCRFGCQRDERGRYAEPCAIARALRAIDVHDAHVADDSIVSVIEESARIAGAARVARARMRAAVERYAPRVAAMHPQPGTAGAGRTPAEADAAYAKATSREAVAVFMAKAQRGEWDPDAHPHEHDARCAPPFTALAALDDLAATLELVAHAMREEFETSSAETPPTTGRKRQHLTVRRVAELLRADGMLVKDIARLLGLTEQRLNELRRPPRARRARPGAR